MKLDDMTPEEYDIYIGINALVKVANRNAHTAGWYTDPKTGRLIKRNFGEVVALMHSELSEALEADRKDLMDDKLPTRHGVEVEFADTMIRIADTSGENGHDLAGAIIEKMRFNAHRPDHKLEARAAGGKKY